MAGTRGASLPAAGGVAAGLAGLGLVGAGLWARREVARTLARERIVSTPDADPPSALVAGGAAARSLAEVIRSHTLDATGGLTYAEVEQFVARGGGATSDPALALVDERTGRPVEHPDHALWVQSIALQSALMQAYLASRLAILTVAAGAGFVAVGAALAAAARR